MLLADSHSWKSCSTRCAASYYFGRSGRWNALL